MPHFVMVSMYPGRQYIALFLVSTPLFNFLATDNKQQAEWKCCFAANG